ncbi:Alpha-amylase-related protein [Pseudolycoriella hygida]|uniref:Alpha-amylase n=1 Tax=Pseudolycoriella hygida TaxID=35572 RepID=A0A9Q0N8Z4_9DIPT|nr:Alpha-amylase-related protein [Pseudolycoriella hygida]
MCEYIMRSEMHSIEKFALIAATILSVNCQHNPNFRGDRRAIVQLFEWKFADIARECETFLSKNNFAAVQISPVNENIIIKDRPWWERLQPLSYKILSRSGNVHEFFDMTQRCNKVDILVYVEIVINHMAAPQSVVIGTAGSTATHRNYPSVGYETEDFHKPCRITNYFDAHEVRNCELENMPDLNHASPFVRGKIASLMNFLIDLGAAGFRVSHCKHMWPNDLRDIYKALRNLREDFGFEPGARPFIIQEVLDYGEEPISRTEYASFGLVTEFLYAREVSRIILGRSNVSELIKLGPELGYLNSDDALVFVDDQDSQRGYSDTLNRCLNYKSREKYIMANAFMLAYPYGTIRLMSSYNFSYDIANDGPPMDKDENILSSVDETGNCQNGWICEHRWAPIVELIKFRISVFGTEMTKSEIYEPDTVGFCREDKGFIMLSNTDFKCLMDKIIFVCLPEGEYCDVIRGYDDDGNCLSVIEVDSSRSAVLIKSEDVNTNGVIAFHSGSRIENI